MKEEQNSGNGFEAISSLSGGRRPEGSEEIASNPSGDISASGDNEVREASDKRRHFTAGYKLRILEEADNCEKDGSVGTLLRREGLYSSHLSTWRRQRREGMLSGLQQKRGKKATDASTLKSQKQALEKENERLKAKLEKAEIIIEFQKKASQILQMAQKEDEKD